MPSASVTTGIFRTHGPIVFAAAFLMTLGVLGIARSQDLSNSAGRFVGQQVVWCLVAIAAMGVTAVPSYRVLSRFSYAAFAAVLLLLVAVYWFPAINGAHRWIRLGPLSLQPSELAKIAYVGALARYLSDRDSHRSLLGLLAPLVLTCVPVVLVLREPDLGTSLVFFPVLAAMLYVAGTRARHLATLFACAIVLAPVLWTQMSAEQRSRVTSLFEQARPGERPHADGYQLYQSKQLLALGGMRGSFLAGEPADDRAAYHLPESHTDFIFSVIGERFGWLGLGAVLALYGVIIWCAIDVAMATREPFGRLSAAGIAALFGTQVFINASMTVGLLPVTGLSLPMVSYGGSGMLTHALALGLLMNIAARPGYEVGRAPFRYS
jgi:cell division protein FtsW (lipid II flippase)